MPQRKKEHPEEKVKLHPRNLHRERYDFKLLTESYPALVPFVHLNRFQDESIDFANPEAVKMLNKALLKQYYKIETWDIPADYLCPPIPGRADYLHYIADLLADANQGKIPTGKKINCLDIGVGANCVYPIIGNATYGWSFIGSDVDAIALESANHIIESNPFLKKAVVCRLQPNPKNILQGILGKDEYIDVVICNPPFHDSWEAAQASTLRKLNHLNKKKVTQPTRNFGGQAGELWCEGGEKVFITDLILESKAFATSCFWFSTLVSNADHLKSLYHVLADAGALDVKTIPMGQGHKTSRILAWSFLKPKQQEIWRKMRWQGK
ncbi:MAG: 23S rRNA (adenine(1618)-N(6))-methyltransferase RlmF [Saprospiraceae bacterium]|mgnify:CR=1 FL=1|nr:23S rRNA (adenine(1618)-N(6))-methyltransferase RlmF [Saprospiraceae bacterium]